MSSYMDFVISRNVNNSLDTPEEIKELFLNFLYKNQDRYFSRENINGHITCSMLVLNEAGTHVLLAEHAKFNKWLQLGGHNDIDGETPLQAALREMFEEAFAKKKVNFNLLLQQPIDLDAHMAGDHMHYDICFVCEVKNDIEIICSKESKKLQWHAIQDVLANNDSLFDERLRRMVKKAIELKLNNKIDKEENLEKVNFLTENMLIAKENTLTNIRDYRDKIVVSKNKHGNK